MSTRARAGFTIIEIVVVLLIISVAAGLAAPAFRSFFEEDDLTAATHRFQTLFTFARDSAIHGGQPVTVLVDSVSGRVWLDTPAQDIDPDTLPVVQPGSAFGSQAMHVMRPGTQRLDQVEDGEPLDLPPSIHIELTKARARFTFAPSGAAWADSLVLRSTMGLRLLTLNPWTGDVVVY
jgi:prepilin-type N-terminal cleavage/methylation domain-containing protein